MKKTHQHVNIDHKVMPVFSDRSITASHVASKPGKKKGIAERKEGTVRIIFIDSVSGSSVADVVLTPIAAEQLNMGIRKSLEQLEKELNNPKMPQRVVPEKPQHTYIG